MYSSIFQVGLKPIVSDEFITPDYFYDELHTFADFIDDEVEGDERKKEIRLLAKELSCVFDFDEENECLIRKGNADFEKFSHDWIAEIRDVANRIDDNSNTLCDAWSFGTYRLKKLLDNTHIGSYCRFYIDDYVEYAASVKELVGYGKQVMKEGEKLYFGAVIKFHF